MAKHTTQIRSIVESGKPIFDFDYPIFDEDYRGVLEQNIIDYFYFREIGAETVAQFKHFLKSKMRRIMPYYNQLYETENLITKDDYNINLNTVETHTKTTDVTANSTSVGESTVVVDSTETNVGSATDNTTSKQIFSDTPQAKLSTTLDYATNLTDNDVDNTSTSDVTNETDSTQTIDDTTTNNGTVTTIEDFQIKLEGGGGVRYNSDVLMEWRKTFLRIDQEIIDELHDLFMSVY